MICELCKGNGWVQGQAPDITTNCPACSGKGFIDMTNEEWLRSCSTEEIAEMIAERIINSHTLFEYILHQDNRDEEDVKREVLKWLKEIHHAN